MYVCLCNVVTDRDVRACCNADATVSGVFRALGAAPQCGKCVPMVRDMLRQAAPAPVEMGGGDD
jgi:bacterioferritin-associated ferredoxin